MPIASQLISYPGLSTWLVSELATHFPAAAGALFHINPQSSRDIKVSSWLLRKAPVSYQCSDTRYSFMWRKTELDDLEQHGYDLAQVCALGVQEWLKCCDSLKQIFVLWFEPLLAFTIAHTPSRFHQFLSASSAVSCVFAGCLQVGR